MMDLVEKFSVPVKQFEISQQIEDMITATRAANVSQIKMYGRPRSKVFLACLYYWYQFIVTFIGAINSGLEGWSSSWIRIMAKPFATMKT